MLAWRPMVIKFYVRPIDFMKCQPDWLVCHERNKKFIGLQLDFLNLLKLFFFREKSLLLLIRLTDQMQFNSNFKKKQSCFVISAVV